jgi:hypothetical protein
MKRKVKSIFRDINFQHEFTLNMENALEREGYELLSDQGKHRMVFNSPKENVVIKVARTVWDIEDNENEYNLWQEYKDNNLICPVIGYGSDYIWIEMKYCEPAPSKFQIYQQKMKDNGIYIPDINKLNVGILVEEGNLVCYDYPDVTKID